MSTNKTKAEAIIKTGRPPQSGAFSLLTKGSVDDLPKRRRYLRPYLIGAREGWIRDIGPTEDELSTSQRILIDRAVTFLGAIRLTEEHMREKGLFEKPSGLLNAHLTQHYLAWNRSLIECLRLLGIDRRKGAEAIPTVAEIIEEARQAEAKAGERATKGNLPDDGQPGSAADSPGLEQAGRSAEGEAKDQGSDEPVTDGGA